MSGPASTAKDTPTCAIFSVCKNDFLLLRKVPLLHLQQHISLLCPDYTHMALQNVVQLRDGRLLSYRLAGYPVKSTLTGKSTVTDASSQVLEAWGSKPTVVYHHGWPSSSAEVLAWDKPAAAQGVHMVAVDKPGVGFSTFNPNSALQQTCTGSSVRLLHVSKACAMRHHLSVATCCLPHFSCSPLLCVTALNLGLSCRHVCKLR
jgi:hypothetical protein